MEGKDKKIKETIHKTEFVDKDKSEITVEKMEQKSMTNWKSERITVKDETSEKAYRTYKKIKGDKK